jgi:hypothetical protein
MRIFSDRPLQEAFIVVFERHFYVIVPGLGALDMPTPLLDCSSTWAALHGAQKNAAMQSLQLSPPMRLACLKSVF